MDFSSLIAAVIGFIVAFVLGFPLIPLLKKLKLLNIGLGALIHIQFYVCEIRSKCNNC